MITLFTIGIFIFTLKLAHFAFKTAWGMTKAVLFVVCLPVILVALFVAGLVSLAMPLLVIGLAAAFLAPVLKRD